MARAFSYIRFSSKVQASGDSLRRQTQAAQRWADANKIHLDTSSYKDLGVSAFGNTARAGLEAFLAAIDSNKVKAGDYLIVESLDRLSRNPDILEAVNLFLSIVSKGIIVVTLSDGFTYSKEDNDVTKLIISITILARGSNESKVKSERLSASWENKRNNLDKKKLTSICPGWLKLSEDKTEFEQIPHRVKLLNKIFEMSRDGIGKYNIARTLNEAGEEPWSTKKRTTNGWHVSYIQKLLSNRAVLGFFTPRKKNAEGKMEPLEEISGYFPQVISDELFYTTQRNRSLRRGGRRGQKYTNILQGLCRCGKCGGSMRLVSKNSNNPKKHGKLGARYYQCDNSLRGIDCRFKGKAFQSLIEPSFLKFVKEVNWKEFDKDSYDEIEIRKVDQERLKFELEQKLDRLGAIEERMINGEGLDTLTRVAARLEEEIKVIERKMRVNQTDIDVLAREAESRTRNIVQMAEAISSETLADRARLSEIIKGAVKNIVIHIEGEPQPYYRVNFLNGDYRLVYYKNDKSYGMAELDEQILLEEEIERLNG